MTFEEWAKTNSRKWGEHSESYAKRVYEAGATSTASKEAVTLTHEQILEIGRRYGLWTLLSEAEGRLKFMIVVHAILAQRDASKAEGQS